MSTGLESLKKSGILKVGQEVCKKSGNFTIISKKFGKKKIKMNSENFFPVILIQHSLELYPTNKNRALNNVSTANVCAHVRLYVCFLCIRANITCQERTLCMFCTCEEQTSNQEQTHSMSTVGFGFCFGLVILDLGIDSKIIGVVCVHSWHWNYLSKHFIYKWKFALGKTHVHSSPHFTC